MSWKMLNIAILAASTCHAAVEKEINEKQPIQVCFSTTSHNRVSVESGSVEKIIADSGVFSVILEKNTGSAFVNVLRKEVEKPLTLTIVTSTGLIQDLAVTAKEGASEQLILRERDEEEEAFSQPRSLHAPTIELLNQILEGKTPIGYGIRAVEEKDNLDLPKPLQSTPIKVFEGTHETIIVHRVKNEGEQPIVLTSDTFKKTPDSWVFLNAHELTQEQQMICIMSQPKARN